MLFWRFKNELISLSIRIKCKIRKLTIIDGKLTMENLMPDTQFQNSATIAPIVMIRHDFACSDSKAKSSKDLFE